MLVFAAFAPHPLIAIPEIGKNKINKVKKTIQAFGRLTEELYSAKPDIIIILTPHAPSVAGAFTINQRPKVIIKFSKYGNLTDRLIFINEIGFGYKVRESTETIMPILLTDKELLDYGSAVPLYYLTKPLDLEQVKIVVIGSSDLDLSTHYRFGQEINRNINETTDRIAVIASGDLAHGVTHDSVVPYDQKAAVLNKMIAGALVRKDANSILSIKLEQVKNIPQCGLCCLAMLLGIIDQRVYTPNMLSYETALGVGYLTIHFQFS
jgi:MEMO1 family protein